MQEEINNKVVVEEYVEDRSLKSSVPAEREVLKSSYLMHPTQKIQQESLT